MLQNADKKQSIPVDRRTVEVVMLNGNSIQFHVEVSHIMWQTWVLDFLCLLSTEPCTANYLCLPVSATSD